MIYITALYDCGHFLGLALKMKRNAVVRQEPGTYRVVENSTPFCFYSGKEVVILY